jgi:hypothetical protein
MGVRVYGSMGAGTPRLMIGSKKNTSFTLSRRHNNLLGQRVSTM